MSNIRDKLQQLILASNPVVETIQAYQLPIEDKIFLDSIWPSGQLTYHPLNPAFSNYIQSIEQFAYHKLIWLWDGAYGLFSFFCRFPKPPRGDFKILISAELAYIIPEDWLSHVYLYRSAQTEEVETDAYILLAICNSLSLPWYLLKKDWDQHQTRWGKKKDLIGCIWKRHDPLTNTYESEPIDYELITFIRSMSENIPKFMVNFEDIKQVCRPGGPSLLSLDVYHQSRAYCFLEHMWRIEGLSVQSAGTYQGLENTPEDHWDLSKNHRLELFSPESIQHHDFSRIQSEIALTLDEKDHPFVLKSVLLDFARSRLEFSKGSESSKLIRS